TSGPAVLPALFAHVGQKPHEAGPLDGRARGPLERGAVAASLAREHLILVGTQFLQEADVFVVDIRRPGATFARTKSAPILAIATKLLPRHKAVFLRRLRTRLLSCGNASSARPVEDFRRNGETMSVFHENGGVKLDASTERGFGLALPEAEA